MDNLEKKILEEIKRRVIEKDKKLRDRKDSQEISKATKQALDEMTELNYNEVEAIEREVRQEMYKKRQKRRKLITWVVVIVAITGFIVALSILFKKPKVQIIENFNDSQRGWEEVDVFEYKRKIVDGHYLYETNEDGWCYWDNIPVELPDKYTIELKSTWLTGKYAGYGLMLLDQQNNYYTFQVRADGAASTALNVNDKWKINNSWLSKSCHPGDGETANIQKLVVDNKKYNYFVNDKLIKKGDVKELEISSIGVRVCNIQTVAFDYLTITNNTTGKKIIDEQFENTSLGWIPKEKFEKKAYFKNGKYYFSSNTEDYCYWKDIPIESMDEFEVELTSIWQKGETANYGLMIMTDDENYLSLEMQNDGSARMVKCYNGEYTDIQDHVPTPYQSNGKNSQTQKVVVDGTEVKYFLNDKLIKRGIYYNSIYNIGVRVCGRQSVAFDKLVIQEK